MQYDDSQIRAIKEENNCLLIAGAGSGKTATIIGKVRYLIEEKKIDKGKILLLSFTNEAVNSLKEKLATYDCVVDTLTFHKLSMRILNNGHAQIIDDDYLEYIIDEYFKSYIFYDSKRRKEWANYLYKININDAIFKSKIYLETKKTIYTFIKLAKGKNLSYRELYAFYKRSFFRDYTLLKYILDIFLIYKNELESFNGVDFDDLIIEATKEVTDGTLPYKYVIIDEFQDTSKIRLDLILKILKVNRARGFFVGDDWQSIYRFSGCNINIFLNIAGYIPDIKILKLQYTYRNSQELCDICERFILKNKYQLKKDIKSTKHIDKPIYIMINYSLPDLLRQIDNEDLMIIGRTNEDIAHIDFPHKLTIHRAKGLEAKNVILVNSQNIPHKCSNNRIFRFLEDNKRHIIDDEERRLFYVALTRCQEHIYIMTTEPLSPFLKEIIRDGRQRIAIKKYHRGTSS